SSSGPEPMTSSPRPIRTSLELRYSRMVLPRPNIRRRRRSGVRPPDHRGPRGRRRAPWHTVDRHAGPRGGHLVKVCMFHLMPYRDLPADFERRYKSAYIDPVWFDVADPDKVGQYYNWTLDEFVHAARAGIHGLCTNQHHQNVYGFMANPSLMGAA